MNPNDQFEQELERNGVSYRIVVDGEVALIERREGVESMRALLLDDEEATHVVGLIDEALAVRVAQVLFASEDDDIIVA